MLRPSYVSDMRSISSEFLPIADPSDPDAPGSRLASPGRIVAPYVTAKDSEQDLTCSLVLRPDGLGVGYANELPGDRDAQGVLWRKVVERRDEGKPEFSKVHPARQRRAMSELLCQVCAGPADQTADGVLWLMRDYRGDWPRWPEGMASVEPPICAQCVAISLRRCPALQRGAVAIRARTFAVAGVSGILHRPGTFAPVPVEAIQLSYGDPRTRWMVAVALIRELRGCSFVSFDQLRHA
ncbi:hypothetical protein SAMN05216553_118118 [Lentzea fradiae]|uniref:Uncharacterized protein n=1 Tax=Lentzea fradiae TaxID=200378 RepID=A0A1G8AU99_9PSEU|nr:hypothetical protein SAMN05216553_118118 [Lentzea fradiae]